MKSIRLAVSIAFALALVATPFNATATAAQPASLTGVLGVSWGDSPQIALPPVIDLYEAGGRAHEVNLPPAAIAALGGIAALNGTPVTVRGILSARAVDQNGQPVVDVSSVEPGVGSYALTSVTGSKPWVILLCKFSGKSSEPRGPSYFKGLWSSTYPGISNFWKRISYGKVNLNGTTVVGRWKYLPHSRSYYITSSGAKLQTLTNDCSKLFDSTIDYSKYAGVSMMFNAELDGYSWGGTTYLNRDGVSLIRATWTPPWGYENQNVLAHEVGHGFGLPHSSGPYNQTYDSPWDVMSAWPQCPSPRTYGCIGVETISYHRRVLGWIASSQVYVPSRPSQKQITLERLAQPPAISGSYLMAKIPIPGSSTRFYTVEVRRFIDSTSYNDYEEGLIASGVIIHLVDTTRTDRVAQVVDRDNNGTTADSGSYLKPGQKYCDDLYAICVSVNKSVSGGYVVTIQDGT
jgi:M6 family metalloprotease-like protein